MVELSLVLRLGDDRKEFKLLAGGPPIVVGRGADANLRIEQPLLSRRHFELRWDEDRGLVLEDLRSANGTYVNGTIAQKARLKPGDVIRAGDAKIRVEFDPQAAAPVQPPTPTGAWIADAVTGDLRCNRCGRLVSMATVSDEHSFEWGEEFLCPSCREGSDVDNPRDLLGQIKKQLREEGFEVLERISQEGALIPVFKARRTAGLEDVVAIKALPLGVKGLSEKKIERFKTEARSMAQLKHPNVPHVYDVRTRPDLIFIVMEWIDGETLLRRIESGGKVPAIEALRIGLGIARALEAAAKHGIVHRNVKPGNILLPREGVPKLIDFGLAKGVRSFGPSVTDEEQTLGTIRYMPPEQLKDARIADARSDIYALAATLYHALTGKLPHSLHSELDLLKSVVRGKLPEVIMSPTDPIPDPVAKVLLKALKKKPEERQPTAAAFRDELARAASQVSGGRAILASEDSTPMNEPAAPGGMSGAFSPEHPVGELVQMLSLNAKSGVLAITCDATHGEVFFQAGKLTGARTDAGLEGEPAALALFGIDRGSFEFKPELPEGHRPSFVLPPESLLLEALRRRDERGATSS
jgi:serine/threonine protein kinase